MMYGLNLDFYLLINIQIWLMKAQLCFFDVREPMRFILVLLSTFELQQEPMFDLVCQESTFELLFVDRCMNKKLIM